MTSNSPRDFSTETDEPPRQFSVFDIDGVLADVRHRLHYVQRAPKDWDGFFAHMDRDLALEEGLAMVLLRVSQGDEIVYLTGRNEGYREVTAVWLAAQGLPTGRLIMRRDSDRRPARFFKPEALERLSQQGTINIVVDDDDAVVTALRAKNWPVFHATWMPSDKDEQQSLFNAQEVDGRN